MFLCDRKFTLDANGYEFQTPAPRGGVPLNTRVMSTADPEEVSNPCASGRCSSVGAAAESDDLSGWFQTPAPRGGVPLVCKGLSCATCFSVSNPCASGRCSSDKEIVSSNAIAAKFQTPAPRGGVPLAPRAPTRCLPPGFKPLRLGAVFLCSCSKPSPSITATAFQTPAPRGGVPLAAALLDGSSE